MVQLTQDEHMMSVKTHGPLIGKVESINRENMMGAYLNDGVSLIQHSGREYLDICGFWNWTMLPGTTCDTTTLPNQAAVFNTSNQAGFVGQVSDENNGLTTMAYNRLGIRAHKSYFMVNDMLVALGAGIEAVNAAPCGHHRESVFLPSTINAIQAKLNQTVGLAR